MNTNIDYRKLSDSEARRDVYFSLEFKRRSVKQMHRFRKPFSKWTEEEIRDYYEGL